MAFSSSPGKLAGVGSHQGQVFSDSLNSSRLLPCHPSYLPCPSLPSFLERIKILLTAKLGNFLNAHLASFPTWMDSFLISWLVFKLLSIRKELKLMTFARSSRAFILRIVFDKSTNDYWSPAGISSLSCNFIASSGLSLFAISDSEHLFDSRRIQIPRSVTDKTISLCTSAFDVAHESRLEVKHSPGTSRENLMMAQFVSETASSLSCNQLFARKGLIAPTLLILSVGPTIIALSL